MKFASRKWVEDGQSSRVFYGRPYGAGSPPSALRLVGVMAVGKRDAAHETLMEI